MKMVVYITENLKMILNMVMVSLFGQTEKHIMENSKKVSFMARLKLQILKVKLNIVFMKMANV